MLGGFLHVGAIPCDLRLAALDGFAFVKAKSQGTGLVVWSAGGLNPTCSREEFTGTLAFCPGCLKELVYNVGQFS